MPVDPSRFRQLVSGQSRGLIAASSRAALKAFSWPYEIVIRLRNAAYQTGWAKIEAVNVPVISVGNLTTGGTGKTPVVAALVQQLQNAGHQPGIVSRGYRADESGSNDEKRVLEHLCPGVPHFQGPNRVAVAKRLIQQHSVSVIVLDDGFQHRRIQRDYNLVLIDATDPYGLGCLLPRGFLREPVSGLKRADHVCVTRSDQVDESELVEIETRARKHLRDGVAISRVVFRPSALTDRHRSQPATCLQGQTIHVATAIGNPDAFVASLESLGATIVGKNFFPDHHHFSSDDLQTIQQAHSASGAEIVVTTLKDYVKLDPLNDNLPLCFLNIAAEFNTEILRDSELTPRKSPD